MRRDLLLAGAYVRDRQGILYEVVERENTKVTLRDVSHRTNPDEATVSWLIGTAESRLTFVTPLQDWTVVAAEAEWGALG
jgi:hypothetical protein